MTETPKVDLAISDEELRVAFAGPAILANRILVTKTSAGLRMAFLEKLPDKVPSAYRTAVVVGYQDAISLKELLIQQLKEIEDQLAATDTEAKVPPQNG